MTSPGRGSTDSSAVSATNRDAGWRGLPGSSRFLIHPTSGRSARPLRALAGTSDWRRGIVDRAGIMALTAVGSTRLPGRPEPSWPGVDLAELLATLRSVMPGLRVLGAVAPRQRHRQRLSILARMSGGLIVAKLGGDDDRLEREAIALRALDAHPIPGVATPEVVAFGRARVGDSSMTYLATTSIALGRQRPAIDEPLRTFEDDLAARLDALPRPDGTAPDAVPVHGDLSPWNLRRTPRGLALFDWEEAGWGAPGSDLTRYRSTCDEVRPLWRARPEFPTVPEAARYEREMG